jgi:mannose-6-phosphate isomerase-like protein (cupin superfamily)
LHRNLRHNPLFHDIDFECNHRIAVLVNVVKENAMDGEARQNVSQIWDREAMSKRLVRYADLKPCYNAFIDTRTPGSHAKENFTIIGPGVSENPEQFVHIAEPHGFNIGGARQPPHCVNSQHSHDTAEVFLVHSGQWRFDLGEHGEDAQVFIGPGDVISLPTKMFRGFTNVGTEVGFLFAVLGGDDPGKVLWAPQVFELAAEHGLVLLETGRLIDQTAGQSVPADVAVMPVTSPAQVAALTRATPTLGEGLVWRAGHEAGAGPETGHADIIGPNAPLNWPHDFTLDRLTLGSDTRVEMDNIDRPTVLFVQSGQMQVAWNTDALTLDAGDTLTLPMGISVTLSAPASSVIYRVVGQ